MQIDLGNGVLDLKLIQQFQGLAWIPTIKGGLSFDVVNTPETLIGDRDKKVAHMKLFNNMRGRHYVVATSLCTFEDDHTSHKSRKCHKSCSNYPDKDKEKKKCRYKDYCTYPKKYNHTFRFIFVATVSDNVMLKGKQESESFSLTNAGQFLTGRLYIIPQMGKWVDTDMSAVLDTIYRIADKCTAKSNNNRSTRLTGLLEYTKEMNKSNEEFIALWKEVTDNLNRMLSAYARSKVPRPVACIETLLSRDGMLLFRNATDLSNLRFFKGFRDSLDSGTVPMHRIFKTAATYVKFLFHKNYNHHDKNDSYMPVSNLRNVHNQKDMSKIVRHQMESLLVPVIQLRRQLYKKCNCNPVGIIGYARAFLESSRKQGWLISKCEGSETNEYEVANNFISDLMEDVRAGHEQTRNSVLDFLTVQRNPIAFFAIVLTFALAAKEIIDLFDPEHTGFGILQGENARGLECLLLLAFSVLVGILIQTITTILMKQSYFQPNNPKTGIVRYFIMRGNSLYADKKETKLPLKYRCWLSWVDLKTDIRPIRRKMIGFIASLSVAIASIWAILQLLR